MSKIAFMAFGILLLLCAILMVDRALLNHSNIFVLDKNIHVLILGDSRTKYDLNDKILSNTFNLSNDADSYFYSYLKLKALTKSNPQITTLILSFSQHNIEKMIENRWLLNDTHINQRLKIYYVLLDTDDFLFLLKQKPVEIFTNLFPQIIYPLKLFQGRDLYGGFSDMDHNDLKEEIDSYLKKTKGNEEEFLESSIETKYLDKIKEYCNIKRIKLILINPPLHKTLNSKQENLYAYYNKHLLDVPFLDFSKLDLPDSCFSDLVHLSPAGSNYFSHYLQAKGVENLANERILNWTYK
ncbi:MAG: hypothetical protein ACM3MI_01135 [Clostridiales bacterium]